MIQNKGKQIALTGDRPTGRLHLGHYVGSLKNRVKMQDEFKQFVMVADVQALTDNADNPDKVRNNVLEVALDNLAAGIDPAKTTFFIQSMVPEIAELTIFFLNLVTVARLERNPTVKNEMRQKGFEGNVPAGFLAYPVSQAADILTFKATHVPVGEDQLPVLEQANEIAHKFNSLYGETFLKIEPIISHAPRLMGIDGGAKMSKSLNNAIFLSDDAETIKKKVMQMYTDPKHIHVNDPGNVEGNVVFDYLTIFDPNQDEVNELKNQYKKGGLGDTAIKNRLADVLENIIAPIREKREYLAAKPDYVMNILLEGTKEARKVAAETMAEVKKAMKINY
jgi:tryptophanyl-tRNA synthetase